MDNLVSDQPNTTITSAKPEAVERDQPRDLATRSFTTDESRHRSQYSIRSILLWVAAWAILFAMQALAPIPSQYFFGLFVLAMIAQVQLLLPKIPPMLSSAFAGAACFTMAPIFHGLDFPPTRDALLLLVIGAMAGFAVGLFVTIAIELAARRVWVAK